MIETLDIKKLHCTQIDHIKWDKCISESSNGIVYAYAWYLDIVCEDWEAIVVNDYQIVLPLPISTILNFKVIRLPELVQQLGFFSPQILDPKTIRALLKHLKSTELVYTFNAYNHLPQQIQKKGKLKHYHVIDLIPSMDVIEKHFSKECIKTIHVMNTEKISVVRSQNPAEYISFKLANCTLKKSRKLERLIAYAIRYKSAGTYGAYNKYNQLIAQAFLLKTNNRIVLIDACDSTHERENIGLCAIIYHIIKANCESNLTLEFPYHSKLIGHHFSGIEHECLQYAKGWLKWFS